MSFLISSPNSGKVIRWTLYLIVWLHFQLWNAPLTFCLFLWFERFWKYVAFHAVFTLGVNAEFWIFPAFDALLTLEVVLYICVVGQLAWLRWLGWNFWVGPAGDGRDFRKIGKGRNKIGVIFGGTFGFQRQKRYFLLLLGNRCFQLFDFVLEELGILRLKLQMVASTLILQQYLILRLLQLLA